MPETTARELKLIQYLNEAYGKEKQLETVLQAQIKIMDKPAVKKRFQDHLKETKAQARGLEKRIKQLGGKAEALDLPGPDRVSDAAGAAASLANKAMAAAKGPIQALRGTSPADNQLRNLRDAYWNEAEEIAHYTVIEAFATQLKDTETAKLAREYRRQEERVQKFIDKQLTQLVKDVIKSEIPARERTPAAASSSRSSSRSTSSRSSSGRSTAKRSSGGRKKASSSRSSAGTAKRSTAAKRSSSGSSRSTAAKRSSSSRSSGSTAKRSSSSRSSGSTAKRSSSGGSSRSRASSGSSRSRSTGSSGSGGSSS
jgi:ferritin-like metal-binding protein YciE